MPPMTRLQAKSPARCQMASRFSGTIWLRMMAAAVIEQAVSATIRNGTVTADLGGKASTTDFSKAVISALQSTDARTAAGSAV